MSGIGL